MCNRHVAQMISEYEAARLDEDEGAEERSESNDSEGDSTVRSGLLATVVDRLAR